jgi:hypothetical protein
MKEFFEFTQAGVTNVIFTKYIIYIEGTEHNYANVHIEGFTEPLKLALSVNEILAKIRK